MSSFLLSCHHFLGLRKSVPWGLYSYFGIFRSTYINIKKKDLLDFNFVLNKEWFEISRWTNGTWFLHNVPNRSGDVYYRNERWFPDPTANFSCHNQPTFSCYTTFPNFYIFLHRNCSSNNDSLQKHQSECTFTWWRHRILRHCSRSTTRGHASPIPLYHLSRLCA